MVVSDATKLGKAETEKERQKYRQKQPKPVLVLTLIEPCRRHLHGNYFREEGKEEKRKIKQRCAAVRQVTSGSLGRWVATRMKESKEKLAKKTKGS